MPFDPNAFGAGTAQPDRRRPGFDPDAFAGDLSAAAARPDTTPTAEGVAGTAALGAGSAAATAYGFSGDAISPRMVADTTVRPLISGAGRMFQQYAADPFKAGRDIAASKVMPGMIPGQVAREAAPEMRQQMGKVLSSSPLTTSATTGSRYPGSVPDYRAIQRQVGPELGEAMTAAYQRGGNQDVLRLMESDARFQRMAQQQPGIAQAMESYRGQVPRTGMQQLGRAAGLVGRTAARFAGPVGLAMTAYDVYQLGDYLYDQYQQRQQRDQERDEAIRDQAAQRALRGPQ